MRKSLRIGKKNISNLGKNQQGNTKPLMIGVKPRDAIKLGIVRLDKSEKYPEENVLHEDGLYRIYISLVNNMRIEKEELKTFTGVKILGK